MSSLSRSFDRVDTQFATIESLIASEPGTIDASVPEVSGWSVRQQLDHVLKVLAIALVTFEEGREPPARGIQPIGRLFLALGWLPRGVARSPQQVLPAEASNEALLAEAKRLRALYADPAFRGHRKFADPAPVFPHPYFGGLSRAQTIRLLGMHTHHHWKIVRDIRAAARKNASTAPGRAA